MAEVTLNPECEDPKQLYGQGFRAYVIQDYDMAVNALSKATELLVAEHKDDLHEALGEVYLYYGKSLLCLSREQNEALGDAVPKKLKPQEQDDDKDEEEEEEEESGEVEEAEEGKTDKPAVTADEEGPSSSNQHEAGPSSSTATAPEGDAESDAQPPQEDDDLQVAWEVLELAKKIFQKTDDKKNWAETLITLGEISLENENFKAAIEDIKEGLNIQREILNKNSRTIAETLYKLGMAYATDGQMAEAIDSLKDSLECLKQRVQYLEQSKDTDEQAKEEIEEIRELMPDVEEKLKDMELFKDEAAEQIKATFLGEPEQKPAQNGSDVKVNDISHLVKKKRKLEDTEDEPPSKKPAVSK